MDAGSASQSIVRILDDQHTVVGLGTYVAPDIVLTCRHVVQDATDVGSASIDRGAVVKVDMPFAAGTAKTVAAEVVVEFTSVLGAPRDLAVLRLVHRTDGMAIKDSAPLSLEAPWHRKFAAFGCPPGHDTGVWATGRILGPTTSGLIALEAESQTGYQIENGFSGGPVFDHDTGTILGIVVSRERKREVRGGFMLPVSEIANAWTPLRRRTSQALPITAPSFDLFAPVELNVFVYSAPHTHHEFGLIERLVAKINSDPIVRGLARLNIVTWTEPFTHDESQTLYTQSDADTRNLRRPSDCELVIVIIWDDPGPPVGAGTDELSAAEWVLKERGAAGDQPRTYILNSQAPSMVSTTDPHVLQRIRQDQVARRVVHQHRDEVRVISYADRLTMESRVEDILRTLIKENSKAKLIDHKPNRRLDSRRVIQPVAIWPYPGLRSFRSDDRSVYFGRDGEADLIVTELDRKSGPILVAGASGSGKSSLVSAGLVPMLDNDLIPGSSDWLYVRMSPAEVGDDPVIPLAYRLHSLLPERDQPPRVLLDALRDDPRRLVSIIDQILSTRPEWSRVVWMIDQFEELLTLASATNAEIFVEVLRVASQLDRLSLVLVIRSDFLANMLSIGSLAKFVQSRLIPLGGLDTGALAEVVERPAALAGLEFQPGLAEVIVRDAVATGGSLPLLAYALSELEPSCIGSGSISYEAYEQIGGVHGALARRAAVALTSLELSGVTLAPLFARLVSIQGDGSAVKRRVYLDREDFSALQRRAIENLVVERLLTASANASREPYVELVHEALMDHWPALADWLKQQRGAVGRGPHIDLTHRNEMGRRRLVAVERSTSGAVFHASLGPYDGRYCWIQIDRRFYETYLLPRNWRSSRSPGIITQKVQISSAKEMPIIFRLRGGSLQSLSTKVDLGERVIGEFWPNAPAEGFRGINLVLASVTRDPRIDLWPASEQVFTLSVRDGRLVLED
ncbi:serine protease [Kribbella sp. NBC_01484]|uniref:S1 family peptidase n=1 Tax=Kribbella sp. NBC_01484 TaxID=2903579 RepID=UPI002E329ABC|nr:serine protease [Kribbella sp. NBC_01484]